VRDAESLGQPRRSSASVSAPEPQPRSTATPAGVPVHSARSKAPQLARRATERGAVEAGPLAVAVRAHEPGPAVVVPAASAARSAVFSTLP
jgi:hypothetical protein